MDNKLPLRDRHRPRRLILLRLLRAALAGAVVCGGFATLRAEAELGNRCCVVQRSQDTIWLVSTRHLGCAPCQSGCPSLCVSRYAGNAGWTRASVKELCAVDTPETITTALVHGNRVDRAQAVARGMAVYRALASRATDQMQLRHVIWSWPAERTPGPLRDARAKAQRTESEAYYLSCLLTQLESDTPVSLIAHSFGVRVVTGSLHLLAGGSLAGRVLPRENTDVRMPVRVVAVAAAMDNHWLLPGHRHGLAVNLVDQMLISYNPRDPVLRRYRWIADNRSGSALGYSGLICSNRLGEAATRIQQINVSPWIGKTHSMDNHLRSNVLMHEIGRVAFWQ